MVGVHLHLIQVWPLGLESIENTAKQQNICFLYFRLMLETKLKKLNLRKQGLQTSLHIGPACAKSLRNEKTKVH